jgi:parallel beta-helix repeat protein
VTKSVTLLLVLVFLTASCLIVPLPVKAGSRMIVVPDDYSTITAAIGNSTNGDTILVRSGTYEGPINITIVIDKSISIIGQNPQNTIIKLCPAYNVTWILYDPFYSTTDGITITAGSCVLQDLTIQMANPAGGSITAQGNNILIANNRIITGQMAEVTVKGSNCRVTNNDLDGMIQVYGNYNQIDKNSPLSIWLGSVTDNGASFNIIEDNTCKIIGLRHSTNNVVLSNSVSGGGINLMWSDNNFFYKNRISGDICGVRFWLSSDNIFESNTVTFGVASRALFEFGGAYNNLFSLNNFVNDPTYNRSYVYDDFSDPNMHTYVASYSTNVWSDENLGNYWNDYLMKYPNATEVGSTGVGNIPYVINDNNSDPYPLMTNYDISTASIQLPDWTNLNLPTLRPTPSFPPLPSPSPSHNLSPSSSPSPSSIASPSLSPSPTLLPTQEPFPTTLVAVASVAVVVMVGVGLLVYFKKRKHKA